ncbi:MAG: pyridoxamine 5'-phosphate oxidase family protein, partial [Pseudomonadota bacterium]
ILRTHSDYPKELRKLSKATFPRRSPNTRSINQQDSRFDRGSQRAQVTLQKGFSAIMNETSDSIIENPIAKFQHWWQLAIVDTPLKHKNPVCVSTIDRDGYPNGRFVDLKTASDTGFVFCTDLDSSKGIELAENPKIALTIWWDHVGFQIRIKGTAKTINKREADNFWSTRLRDAKITTSSFQQSQLLANLNELSESLKPLRRKLVLKKFHDPVIGAVSESFQWK